MQLKRSNMRAFGAHWNGSEVDILIVVAIYQKTDKDEFWNRKMEFQWTVEDHLDALDELEGTAKIDEWLDEAREDENFLVYQS